uniref:Peptidase U32 collagenase domain-containing protein n=1 Tax=Ditylum brightwellii TaxID=49249 RepID=A0A7S4VGZ5_9STRA
MAPCGGWPQLQAAVANGADSVYLGLSSYSARARANNFDPYNGELADAVSFCHKSNVRVYVALNTLVFDHEIKEVANLIRAADDAGVDALIVQDVGIARLCMEVAPTLEVHASTQQTVTSADGVAFAAKISGATRIVLGRELSVSEIESVMSGVAEESLEVEAFVHGALCVSYSGQCFSSEAWGGRSANRGQCAQACRLPYGLIVDGELRDLQDMTYLLSPQDLCGLDHVPALVRAGVSCLKIEGRLKDASYVAATTRAYRNAVDLAWNELSKEYPHLANAASKRGGAIRASDEVVTKNDLAQLFFTWAERR